MGVLATKFRANTAWEAAKAEKDGVAEERSEMTTKVGELEHHIRIMTSESELFKGNMANLLSTPEITVEPTFEAIRDHFKSTHGQYVNSYKSQQYI